MKDSSEEFRANWSRFILIDSDDQVMEGPIGPSIGVNRETIMLFVIDFIEPVLCVSSFL